MGTGADRPLLHPVKQLLDAAACIDKLGIALLAGASSFDGGSPAAAGSGPRECNADAPEVRKLFLFCLDFYSTQGLFWTRSFSTVIPLALFLSPVPVASVNAQSRISELLLAIIT